MPGCSRKGRALQEEEEEEEERRRVFVCVQS